MPLNESDKNDKKNNLFDEKFEYEINYTGDGVIITKYVNNDTYCIITSLKDESIVAKDDTEVVIPTEINSLPVTTIGDCAFQDDYDFKDDYGYHPISLYERSYDFEDDLKLQSISIPKSVKITGNAGCRCLTSIVIPEGVTSIGKSAFQGCWNLKTLIIPNTIHQSFEINNVLIGNINDTGNGVIITKYVGDNREIVIPPMIAGLPVTTIGDFAFQDNWIFRDNRIVQDNRAFEDDDDYDSKNDYDFYCWLNPQKISIPDSVTTIGDYAFANHKRLQNIIIPESIITIGNSAFEGCRKLKTLIIPNTIHQSFEINNVLIGNINDTGDGFIITKCVSDATEVGIPPMINDLPVTTIDKSAFDDCRNLKTLIIPNTIN